jgi:hypothetical protein
LNSGSGPGFFDPPVNHENDGAGIVGIHDDIVEHPVATTAKATASTCAYRCIARGMGARESR